MADKLSLRKGNGYAAAPPAGKLRNGKLQNGKLQNGKLRKQGGKAGAAGGTVLLNSQAAVKKGAVEGKNGALKKSGKKTAKKNVLPFKKRKRNKTALGKAPQKRVLKKRRKSRSTVLRKRASLLPAKRAGKRKVRRVRKAITPLILPPAIPAVPDPPVQAPPEQPVESDGLVPGELYDPIFSFDIPKPEIKVEPQVWDAVRENLPADYLIPDPAFINVLSGAMDMQTMPESSPAMQQVEADEAVGPLLDASLISFIAQEVTPPSYEPMSPPETPPMPQAQQVQPKAEGSGE